MGGLINNSSNTRKIVNGSTSCRVVVIHYIRQEDENSLDTEVVEIGGNSSHNALLNFTYQKNIAFPYGQFNLTLANDRDYYQLISPGDWIAIYLTNGTQNRLVEGTESMRCLGNVGRIHKKISVANDGTKTTLWQISGADWGKFFHTVQIVVNSQLLEDQIHNISIVGQKDLVKGSSSTLVEGFVEYFLKSKPAPQGMGLDAIYKKIVMVPDKLLTYFFGDIDIDEPDLFYNILGKQITDNSAYEKTYNFTLNTLVPLWTVLKTVSNRVVNELFLEMRYETSTNGITAIERPTIFHRPYPFALPDCKDTTIYNNQFGDLDFVDISTADIIESGLGMSDIERKNYFFIRSNMTGSPLGESMGLSPVYNEYSLQRYGPHIYWPSTDMVDHGVGGIKVLKGWIDLVYHWYSRNHIFESGTMTINGNPGIRVGKRLDVTGFYEDKNWMNSYYIEGYTDQWQFPGFWTQSVRVSRGLASNGQQWGSIYSANQSFNRKETRSVKKLGTSR